MLTQIHLYGVSLSYEEAVRVLEAAGTRGYWQECEREFRSLRDEFAGIDPVDMDLWYEGLQHGWPADYPYHRIESLLDFFDYFGFPRFQIPVQEYDTIPTVYNEQQGIQFYRHRYYADLFSEDADSRGDSLRILPERASVYGIYIASDGYAYTDDIREFEKDPRIEGNFAKHCVPVLETLGLVRAPERIVLYQTW